MMILEIPRRPRFFPNVAKVFPALFKSTPVACEVRAGMPRAFPGAAAMEAIAALTDPVQRNLQITLAYNELTHAMATVLGQKNVSWCAYATWASKTAGAFIRGEITSLAVREYLEGADYVKQSLASFNRMLARFDQNIPIKPAFFTAIIAQMSDEIARHVAHGNLIVFAEMAPLFGRFLETLARDQVYNRANLERFLRDNFVPGTVEDGGQDMLIIAFTHYYKAMFATEAKTRAELILLANLYVGYHEQTRLQGAIRGAMEAPFELRLETALIAGMQQWIEANTPQLLARLIWLTWQKPLKAVAGRIAAEWRTIMTRWFMTIRLPTEMLRLGRDVPPLPSGQMFPAELTRLQHPLLLDLLQQLDGILDSSLGSAANDWGCLRDRMNFVVDFFRSRQQENCLYRQPFSEQQVAVIRIGGIPANPL